MIDITKSRSSKYLLFGSLYFIQGIILAICQLIIPIYLVEKGFPVPLITIVVGIIILPWTIKFFWGALIDYFIRFGRKIFAIFGGIQFASGLLLASFIDPEESIPLPCNKLHGFPPSMGEQNAFRRFNHIIPCDSSHKLKFGDFFAWILINIICIFFIF